MVFKDKVLCTTKSNRIRTSNIKLLIRLDCLKIMKSIFLSNEQMTNLDYTFFLIAHHY